MSKARLKIVTDSTADVPLEWRKRWNIDVIPAFVTFEGKSYPDDDTLITRQEYYAKLANARVAPQTAAPPPGLAQEILARALSEAEDVLVFTVASKISSVYNSIRLAGQAVNPEHIRVIESGSVSMGLGWQVVAAAEALEQGADLDGVLAAANDVRHRTKIWLTVDDLVYLRRSGRINHLTASIGSLLNIKPIITLYEGYVDVAQRVRTLKRAEQTIIDLARKHAPWERLAFVHTAYPEGAKNMQAALADLAPTGPNSVVMTDANTAMGTHYGPIAVGVIIVQQKEQQAHRPTDHQ